jgi:hypothetical protein
LQPNPCKKPGLVNQPKYLKEITVKSIHIRDLEVPGLELLSDEESYLDEMSSHEVDVTLGGSTPGCVAATVVIGSIAASVGITMATRMIHDRKEAWSPIGWL